jgi:hypothetical protein
MMDATHLTALSVPLPAADALVRAAARMFQPDSPMATIQKELTAAHVTVLAPFVPPARINERVFEDLRAICARHSRHEFRLKRVAWRLRRRAYHSAWKLESCSCCRYGTAGSS